MKLLAVFVVLASGPASAGPEVVCAYAPSQSKVVAAVSGAAGGASATLSAVTAATGLTAVAHSSGAVILTGSAGYIAGTIGGAAAAPVIVTVGLVVGGAAVTLELACVGKNHPEQVAKIQQMSEEFGRRFKVAMTGTKVATGRMVKAVGPASGAAAVKVKSVASDAWQYVYRKSSEIAGSIGN
jgi:Na+/phosphate symporter